MYNKIMLLVPVLLPTLVVRTACNITSNSEVVFVPNLSHAEVQNQKVIEENKLVTTTAEEPAEIQATPSTTTPTPAQPLTEREYQEETEGVVFVPNEAPVVRLEDEFDRGGVRLGDLMARRTASDLMNEHVRIETESPPNEIVFIRGSNNDHLESKQKEIGREDDSRRRMQQTGERLKKKKEDTLDCINLDCNNSMKTICGGKIVRRKVQYRLFLNDCYFRKVNCNFQYEINRYKIVPPEKCVRFGINGERPFSFTRRSFNDFPKQSEDLSLRRSFSSRRSMSMNMNGQFCSHACPISCPEDYEPECAVSSTGQHRVFMNHCKLDDNSCLFAIVWHSRPLSECVGLQKADVRQNRHFIGWMQQIGIIDNKGKLVLE